MVPLSHLTLWVCPSPGMLRMPTSRRWGRGRARSERVSGRDGRLATRYFSDGVKT